MSQRVLLVDYDPRSIERIRGLLAGQGIAVEVRRDGASAARDFERLGPVLTLIQELLPGKHGFEVCRELKASALGRRVPVLLMTGVRSGRSRELRDTECDGCVRKPFSDGVLLAAVRRLLPQPVPRAEPRPAPQIPVRFSEDEVLARLDAVMGSGPTLEAPRH